MHTRILGEIKNRCHCTWNKSTRDALPAKFKVCGCRYCTLVDDMLGLSLSAIFCTQNHTVHILFSRIWNVDNVTADFKVLQIWHCNGKFSLIVMISNCRGIFNIFNKNTRSTTFAHPCTTRLHGIFHRATSTLLEWIHIWSASPASKETITRWNRQHRYSKIVSGIWIIF